MDKMEKEFEEILMAKVAWYYYMEDMTQQNIAEHLGMSRMRVIKLLEKARKTGIVQFQIRSNQSKRLNLERELVQKFNLKDTYIVPTNPNKDEINETIAKGAAMYIGNRITDNCFINFGYGDTPSRTLNHLASNVDCAVSYVSLTGGVHYYLPNAQSNIFSAKLYLMPSPLIASSQEMAEAIKNETSIQEISNMTKLASMTIVGIGAMNDNATIIKSGILSQNDFLLLSMKGAVGDILSHFIDKDGNLIENEYESRLISTSLPTIKELDNVIGVAAGENKIPAIRAALKGGYIDVLITDEDTARNLIEQN
ncbi:sugar-binding transcriptional regulator [Anaerocolumna aminovalerica]|mgnify:CR=1 FL=1|uniref:DNA-binding transcriptional regulator LsrR, DeoR family n=1 Tax=Anaerocolumna aminovalerica TaxID=1527 RepID=A0A1I5BZY5_9FIRM|nr:sugar-binding transcriptional regulator [uncultured Anaerocolumna sp.]SFN80313.1 DNA-binding transcriptional regulator LsrR, DeoR family [Anaerocolumna aminovalerica]